MSVSEPQLLVGPNESSSLIRSDSQFTSKKLTLTGDDSGVALNITSTNASSISTLGGMNITGATIYSNTDDVFTDPDTRATSAAVDFSGGVVVRKKIEVKGDACFRGTIFNEDISTKNNLVSQANLAVLDLLYAKRIYCINLSSWTDPIALANNPNTPVVSGGQAILDICIVGHLYCPNVEVLENDSVELDLCATNADISTVIHYYRGENFTGKYCIFDELHVDTLYCPKIFCVRGRPMDTGFGGYANASAGSILGTKTYIGGVQANDTWRFSINTNQNSPYYLRMMFQRFNGEKDDYECPPMSYRTWMCHRDFDTINGTWNLVRAVDGNGASTYFVEKTANAETTYICADVSTFMRSAMEDGYYVNRIYVSYEVLTAGLTSIDCQLTKKVYDRSNPSGGRTITIMPKDTIGLSADPGNLTSGTAVGDHHRYVQFAYSSLATHHGTYEMEVTIVTPATSVVRFHGCFIEYTKHELTGY